LLFMTYYYWWRKTSYMIMKPEFQVLCPNSRGFLATHPNTTNIETVMVKGKERRLIMQHGHAMRWGKVSTSAHLWGIGMNLGLTRERIWGRK
jgi:hypothetical protein